MSIKYKEKDLYKNACIALMISFGIMLLLVVLYIRPYITGDGREYVLQTEALANHFSMDIRDEDFISVKKNFPNYIQYFQEDNVPGLHIANNGKVFCAHYGGYAIFVLPVKIILKVLDFNQLRSFQIVNAIFYIAALFTVYKILNTSNKNKCILLVLLMANPALFYITWTHTEIFSFSLMVMSLVYFYNKNYQPSIFLISLAAMQNPAIIMFGAIIGVDYLVDLYKKGKEKASDINRNSTYILFVKDNWFDIIKAGLCYIPFFLPIIQTIFNFQKLNIVASVASESEFKFGKAMGYLFDLNLGILPYVPIILILYFIFMIIGLYRHNYGTLLQLVGVVGIFYVICNQRQINSGMNGIMRYNIWIIPIMIFYIIMHKDYIKFNKKFIDILLIISAMITSIVFLASGNFTSSKFSSVQFSPWTKLIMNYIPDTYNPYHGIFITRTLNQELYSVDFPVIYRDAEGYVRKILLTEKTVNQLNDMLVYGNEEDITYLNEQKEKVNGDNTYEYINFNRKREIKIYTPIEEFDAQSSDFNYSYLEGVYGSEGEFSWIKPQATIPISDKNGSEKLYVKFFVSDLLRQFNSDKEITVSFKVNDIIINTTDINEFDTIYDIELDIAEVPNIYNKGIVLEINTNAYFNPLVEGMSNDDRDLSIRLIYAGFDN